MKQILLFVATCLLTATGALAKGHGGGHGGHSGGSHSSSHSGGHTAAHTAAHSSNSHSSSGHAGSGMGHGAAHSTTHTRIVINRSTSPRSIAENHPRNSTAIQKGTTAPPRNGAPVTDPGTSHYPANYYGYYNPYYSNPYAYSPYFDMWSLAFNMMYSPSYPYMAGSSGNNDDYSNNNLEDDLEGYAVYAHDTISGTLTLKPNAILLATSDSGKDYDYTFKIRDKELEYVTAFNSEDKQVKLVRLEKNRKKLWRVVHEGKLNLYDDDHGFIYRPEDIDKMFLVARFNGTTKTLNSFYGVKSKEQLTEYVNEAYGLHLDPKNFSWNQLLIYLDKLD